MGAEHRVIRPTAHPSRSSPSLSFNLDLLGPRASAIRSHRVCSRSSTNRSRDGRHAIAVSYFVLVDPGVEPSDLDGMKNSYFNLGEAIEEHRLYDFVRDHRELANTTLGWLRQMASTTPPRLDFVMQTQGRRKVRAVIQNPLMQKGQSSSLDVPVFTHNNGYFLSGVLKPEVGDILLAPALTYKHVSRSSACLCGRRHVPLTWFWFEVLTGHPSHNLAVIFAV